MKQKIASNYNVVPGKYYLVTHTSWGGDENEVYIEHRTRSECLEEARAMLTSMYEQMIENWDGGSLHDQSRKLRVMSGEEVLAQFEIVDREELMKQGGMNAALVR